MHMMVDAPHDHNQRPQHDAVRESAHISGAGGGDW
jgi:hypothetical protein